MWSEPAEVWSVQRNLQEGQREDGEACCDEEVDQEEIALLQEGCDEEEDGEEEDEAPLAGEGEGDPHHSKWGEQCHAWAEGRGASLGVAW